MNLETLKKANDLVQLIREKETIIGKIEDKLIIIRRSSLERITLKLSGSSEELNFKVSKKLILQEGENELYVLRNQVKAHKYNLERL